MVRHCGGGDCYDDGYTDNVAAQARYAALNAAMAAPPSQTPPGPPPPSQTPPPVQISMTVPTSSASSVHSINGTATTIYLTNGQAGVSFNISKSCNDNNGCNGGETSTGIWTNRCHDDHRHGKHLQGTICVSPSAMSACPAIGTLTSAQYYGPNNQPASGGAQNPSGIATLQCTYSSITNPFETVTITSFLPPTIRSMQQQYCDGQNYHDMTLGPCANFYTNNGDFDYQQVLRINEEYPNGTWATIPPLVAVVRRIATGTGSVSTALGKNFPLIASSPFNLCQKSAMYWLSALITFVILFSVFSNQLRSGYPYHLFHFDHKHNFLTKLGLSLHLYFLQNTRTQSRKL